jgi:hypothetical protein
VRGALLPDAKDFCHEAETLIDLAGATGRVPIDLLLELTDWLGRHVLQLREVPCPETLSLCKDITPVSGGPGGSLGMREMHSAGFFTVAQGEASSTVYGLAMEAIATG